MHGSLLAVLVVSVLLAALARRYDVSAPLALVVAGLAASAIPGFSDIELEPELVLYVLLPPLLWSAGLESSYVGLRRNLRPIGLLAVGLPLATTFAVGFVAYKTVPELTVAAGLTLGAIVAPARRGIGDGDRAPARAAAPGHDAARRRKPAQRRDRADRLQGGARRGDRHRRELGQRPRRRSHSRRAAGS